MKKNKIKKIMELHEKWLNNEIGGEKAVFSNKNLQGIDFSGANLQKAVFSGANLQGAIFCDANLQEAEFIGANLQEAVFCDANIHDSYFYDAELHEAIFSGANLQKANFIGANLSGVSFYNANLQEVNICNANLCGADLRRARLNNIKYNIYTSFFALQCPEKGSFIAYKKIGNYIVELLIPEDAKRSSATTRKCRASKAKILFIEDIDSGKEIKKIYSNYNETIAYKVGKTIEVKDFDEDRWNECLTGIHFFMTKQEAFCDY